MILINIKQVLGDVRFEIVNNVNQEIKHGNQLLILLLQDNN